MRLEGKENVEMSKQDRLSEVYSKSTNDVPILVSYSAEVDIFKQIESLAELDKRVINKVNVLSSSYKRVKYFIEKNTDVDGEGNWLILMNC